MTGFLDLVKVKILTDSRHADLLRIAYQLGMENSKDPSTRNGSLLVDPITLEIAVNGWNHFPEGVEITPERLEHPLKYEYTVHAERDAIFNAARKGIATNGLAMYCPWAPCMPCSNGIIQSGISYLVTHLDITDLTPERWLDEVARATVMAIEAGVRVYAFQGEVGAQTLFNGELINV